MDVGFAYVKTYGDKRSHQILIRLHKEVALAAYQVLGFHQLDTANSS